MAVNPNDFDAEALIIARLKASVPELVLVCSLASVAGAANLGDHLPGAIVEPAKSPAEEQFAHGQAAKVREGWRVAVCVRDLPDAVNFSAAFSSPVAGASISTGELLGKVRQALQGWQPAPAFERMQFEGRDEPTGQPGEIVFPLNFSVLHSLEAA